MQPRALLDNDSTYQQNTNSDLNDLERNFWGSELKQLNYSIAALYYCCIHDTEPNASNINLAANQNGICQEQKTCADFNFSNGEQQNPTYIQSSHTLALHSTPSPTEDNQLPSDPGTLHSTPSPTEDNQPPSEKDFLPAGLTYSAIALAVVFLLTTLLIAVALAVLIRTKGRR